MEATIPRRHVELHRGTNSPFGGAPKPTPVSASRLAKWLGGYEEASFVITGLTEGFRVHHSGPLPPPCKENLASAKQHEAFVEEAIREEVALGRIAGPYRSPPLENFVTSPIGAVPKKKPGVFRLIHHLSYPDEESINAGIEKHFKQVSYHNVDMAIAAIMRLGSGCFVAKTDIKNAFRLLPVHPSSYHLLGFRFQNAFYYDRMLAMGLGVSCQIFEKFSGALQWVAQHKLGIADMLHILDDFLIIAPTRVACDAQLKAFRDMCEDVGVPLAAEKTEGPAQVLTFAGIELDTLRLEARLPEEKVVKFGAQAMRLGRRKKCTLREMQSVIVGLNHCCCVIPGGRPFLRRLIELTRGLRQPTFKKWVTRAVRDDLAIWVSFLADFNGRAFMLPNEWAAPDVLQLYTDASTTVGFGALMGKS